MCLLLLFKFFWNFFLRIFILSLVNFVFFLVFICNSWFFIVVFCIRVLVFIFVFWCMRLFFLLINFSFFCVNLVFIFWWIYRLEIVFDECDFEDLCIDLIDFDFFEGVFFELVIFLVFRIGGCFFVIFLFEWRVFFILNCIFV